MLSTSFLHIETYQVEKKTSRLSRHTDVSTITKTSITQEETEGDVRYLIHTLLIHTPKYLFFCIYRYLINIYIATTRMTIPSTARSIHMQEQPPFVRLFKIPSFLCTRCWIIGEKEERKWIKWQQIILTKNTKAEENETDKNRLIDRASVCIKVCVGADTKFRFFFIFPSSLDNGVLPANLLHIDLSTGSLYLTKLR